MKYPHNLRKNGSIGFVAPSFGAATEPYISTFNEAINRFKALGYNTIEGPNARRGDGVGISGTPEECAEEFMDFYERKDSDVLISCGGGELMCTDLSFIDFERIKKADPKWFLGYSDNTNLTFLLTTLCDTASIYGPCAAAFAQPSWHEGISQALEVLATEEKRFNVHSFDMWEKDSLKDEEHPLVDYNLTENVKLVSNQKEAYFSGRLIGGCMDCLNILCGTRFDQVAAFLEHYKEDGFIWFLEACDLNVFSMERVLWQFKEAGWFKYVKGFLIGRPLHFGEEFMGLNQYKAVTDVLLDLNVPIIMDCDLGHLPPQMPMVCGSLAKVEFVNESLKIEMNFK